MFACSCLCKSISFEIDAIFYGRYCHCESCRKFSGTTPAAWAATERGKFKLVSSLETLAKYKTEKGNRCFCSSCGSPTWYESDEFPEILGIPYGILDSGEIPGPELHVWTQSRAPWCDLDNELPKHETHP